jgi:hypothetical protein
MNTFSGVYGVLKGGIGVLASEIRMSGLEVSKMAAGI